jgi:hypothetical protein
MTLKELLDLSTRTLGAIMYTDATGTNLEFRTETARPNPFNGVLKKGFDGSFTLAEALIELRNLGNVAVVPFSRFPLDLTHRRVQVRVSKGSTVRMALNKISRAWGYGWSAAVIDSLDRLNTSAVGIIETPEPPRLVWVQLFAPSRKRPQ